MITFKQFFHSLLLTESDVGIGDPAEHLTHIEDLIIEHGHKGLDMLKKQVYGILKFADALEEGDDEQDKLKVNLKVDGAPALYFGSDPRPEYEGQFFVATKHNLARSLDGQLLNHSVQEIHDNIDKEKTGLITKLTEAYNALKPMYEEVAEAIDYRVVQTDMLFGNKGEKSFEKLDGIQHLTFKPQLIKYAIPVPSSDEYTQQYEGLYEVAVRAIFGIGVHDTWKPVIEEHGGKSRIMLRSSKKELIDKLILSGVRNKVFVIDGTFSKESTGIEIDDTQVSIIYNLLDNIEAELKAVDSATDEKFFPPGWGSRDASTDKHIRRSPFIGEVTSFINNEVVKSAPELDEKGNLKAGAEGSPILGTTFYTKAFRGEKLDEIYLTNAFKSFIDMKAEKRQYTKQPNKLTGDPGVMKGDRGQASAQQWGIDTKNEFIIFRPYFKAMYHAIQLKSLLLQVFDTINSSLKIGQSFYKDGDGTFRVDTTGEVEGHGRGEGYALFVGTNHIKLVDRLVFSLRNLMDVKSF